MLYLGDSKASPRMIDILYTWRMRDLCREIYASNWASARDRPRTSSSTLSFATRFAVRRLHLASPLPRLHLNIFSCRRTFLRFDGGEQRARERMGQTFFSLWQVHFHIGRFDLVCSPASVLLMSAPQLCEMLDETMSSVPQKFGDCKDMQSE